MTEHLPSRVKIELTLPVGMPVGGDFAVTAQSAPSTLLYAASKVRFANLRSYRSGMTTGILCFQPWICSTGNFKSP